jgi:hypothetical protein
VSAPNGGPSDANATYVFKNSGGDTWVQVIKINGSVSIIASLSGDGSLLSIGGRVLKYDGSVVCVGSFNTNLDFGVPSNRPGCALILTP